MIKFKLSEKWILRTVIGLVFCYVIWTKLADEGYVPYLRYIGHPDTLAKYTLTEDWFSSNIPRWDKVLASYKGVPNVRYLEIGVFEGRSTLWMLENILTHPTAHVTAIDIFSGDLEKTFRDNLERSGRTNQVDVLKGDSKKVLRKLPLNTYDIIYIDGSHVAKDVLADAILSWPLLKTGGILIFDDHLWRRDEYPFELRPYVAIESFVSMYQGDLKVIHNSEQVIIKKSPQDCYNCVRIGEFSYSWDDKSIIRLKDQSIFTLTNSEVLQIEKALREKRFGIRGIIDKKIEKITEDHLEMNSSQAIQKSSEINFLRNDIGQWYLYRDQHNKDSKVEFNLQAFENRSVISVNLVKPADPEPGSGDAYPYVGFGVELDPSNRANCVNCIKGVEIIYRLEGEIFLLLVHQDIPQGQEYRVKLDPSDEFITHFIPLSDFMLPSWSDSTVLLNSEYVSGYRFQLVTAESASSQIEIRYIRFVSNY